MTRHVVVVGAGPAGMAAARRAAEAGADVLLINSAAQVGGQYYRRSALGVTNAPRLHERIEHLSETTVWAIEPIGGGQRLRLQTGRTDAPGRTVRTVDAEVLVLATGAYDRALPFPGWDLPGVYTAGAAQALAKGQRVPVGRRVLVAGTGPFLLPVARSLADVNARVVGLLEANHLTTIVPGWYSAPLAAAGKLGEFTSYAATLGRHRIPVHTATAVIAAHGEDRLDSVTVAKLDRDWNAVPGTRRRIEVDAVCIGYGFTAQLELAISAGCKLIEAPDGGSAVEVDADQQTSVPGVYSAGELTGVAGAAPAEAEGAVAGAAAAAQLGHGPGPAEAERKLVAHGNQVARALAKAYPIGPGWRTWLTGDTLVCRCEEVSYDELNRAAEVAEAGRALRLTSRAGLGMCQGRVCARTVAELTNTPLDHAAASRRPIAVPVRMRDLASTPLEEL
jgi:NADPH-dependent 2,4-dienoyl-CoA reductase/sulfur reductase-like enzyme